MPLTHHWILVVIHVYEWEESSCCSSALLDADVVIAGFVFEDATGDHDAGTIVIIECV